MAPGYYSERKKSIYIPEDPGLKQLLLVVPQDLAIILECPTKGVTSQEHVVVAAYPPGVCPDSPPSPMPGGDLHDPAGRDRDHKLNSPGHRNVFLLTKPFVTESFPQTLLPNERSLALGTFGPIDIYC